MNVTRNRPLAEVDKASVFHPVTSIGAHLERGPFIVESGDGCRIIDRAGNSYIDAAAGLWCVNVGYGREALARAMYGETKRMGYYHTFRHASNAPQIELADKVLEILRQHAGITNASRVFFGCTGSDANETQIKIAWFYNNIRGKPEKKKIISRRGAYHGVTLGAGSLTAIDYYRNWFDLPLDFALQVSAPHYYRSAEEGESEEEYSERLANELEATILAEGPDSIAAFIAEPIIGTGGVLVPPRGYFDRVQKLLRDYDILFIVDEVICGFGRLGHWFGSTLYNLEPDLMTLAKGLTSGYFPLSAVVVSESVWEVLKSGSGKAGDFAHGFTYSGHPVGCAVGLENLRIIEYEGLVENAAQVGRYLKQALSQRLGQHEFVGEIRGEGLMLAVELVRDRGNKEGFDPALAVNARVAEKAAENGLLVRPLPGGCVNSFSPPLTLSRDDAEQVADIYADTVNAVTQALS